MTSIRILHTNDLHGRLSADGAARLSRLRPDVDLYLDSGDAIRTGNLGIPLQSEPVWGRLDALDCSASVLGNRETHLLESVFRAKLAGARHPILGGNMRRRDGSYPLPRSMELAIRGVRVGILGVMVPMVTEMMRTKAASVFLWDPPIQVASELAAELRPRVDLLIALTHIGHRQDLELAAQVPSIDVVCGGHSHTVLETPVFVGRTAICQGGSHARYMGVYEWSAASGLKGGLIPFPA